MDTHVALIWLRANQSLFLLMTSVYLEEKQQIPIE
jgi:hypothetical protein